MTGFGKRTGNDADQIERQIAKEEADHARLKRVIAESLKQNEKQKSSDSVRMDATIVADGISQVPTLDEVIGELRAFGMLEHHEAKFRALDLAERLRKFGINLGVINE